MGGTGGRSVDKCGVMGLKSGGRTGVPPNRGAMGGVWASIGVGERRGSATLTHLSVQQSCLSQNGYGII